MVIRRRKRSMMGDTMRMAVGNIVGATMIGATGTAVAGIPASAGTAARSIAGTLPTMQAAGLAGANAGYVNRMLPSEKRFRRRIRRRY